MNRPSNHPPAFAAFRKARELARQTHNPLQLRDVPALLARAVERLASIPRKGRKNRT